MLGPNGATTVSMVSSTFLKALLGGGGNLMIMAEIATKLSWGVLTFIHALPAAVLFRSSLLGQLYGIEASGDLGVLMVHRGALFFSIAAVCAYALFEPAARRTAGIATAISIVSFIALYLRAGLPAGSLCRVAIADVIAVPPLLWVLWSAWQPARGIASHWHVS